jgi:hypothetical protein
MFLHSNMHIINWLQRCKKLFQKTLSSSRVYINTVSHIYYFINISFTFLHTYKYTDIQYVNCKYVVLQSFTEFYK